MKVPLLAGFLGGLPHSIEIGPGWTSCCRFLPDHVSLDRQGEQHEPEHVSRGKEESDASNDGEDPTELEDVLLAEHGDDLWDERRDDQRDPGVDKG